MMVAHPDEVITHCPEASCCCSCGLNDWEELAQEVAQVIDIPPIKAKVTEHRKVGFQGRKCGDVFRENFPTGDMGVNRLQYGANIQSLAVYFNHYHFIPYHRLSEMFSDCFGISLSVGSLVNFMKRAQVSLVLFEEGIKQALLSSPVLHRDETGMRSEGKTIWVHTVSNEHLTYYQLDQHRGTQAMDRGAYCPSIQAIGCMTAMPPMFRYEHLGHSLCNAHLLRELKYLHEQEACAWAEEIKNLLLKAKQHKEQNPSVSKHYKTRIENQFQKIVHRHWRKEEKAMAAQSTDQVCRGKPKRSKAHNLLMALRQHQQAVLAFLRKPLVPFDNNQAERDLRMIKTKGVGMFP